LAAVLIIFCETPNFIKAGVTKDRGVYTTVAMKGKNLDMPASGYISCKTFSPGQTPAAVVVGYGYSDGENGRPLVFNLELTEIATGTILANLDGSAYAGKAAVFDLPIRKSGDYRLRLLANSSVFDTWDFKVNRETSVDTNSPAPALVYAKGNFSASLAGTTDAFTDYDEYLLEAINYSVQKAYADADSSSFVQIPVGQVVIQFKQSDTGEVNSAKIVENTLNESFGKFFLKSLQSGSPYKAWTATAKTALGTNSRPMTVTFYYD